MNIERAWWLAARRATDRFVGPPQPEERGRPTSTRLEIHRGAATWNSRAGGDGREWQSPVLMSASASSVNGNGPGDAKPPNNVLGISKG